MEPTRRVVFVCLHGSAKSLIAAEYFRRLAAQRGLDIDAISAGIDPDLQIPRSVIKGLSRDGIDVRGRIPRQAKREDLTNAWRIVSFGCDLVDMAPAGLTIARWDDVPAAAEDFKAARDAIVTRLQRLLAECESSPTPSAA
jgi:arsenate reductase (thioredoxin)